MSHCKQILCFHIDSVYTKQILYFKQKNLRTSGSWLVCLKLPFKNRIRLQCLQALSSFSSSSFCSFLFFFFSWFRLKCLFRLRKIIIQLFATLQRVFQYHVYLLVFKVLFVLEICFHAFDRLFFPFFFIVTQIICVQVVC